MMHDREAPLLCYVTHAVLDYEQDFINLHSLAWIRLIKQVTPEKFLCIE